MTISLFLISCNSNKLDREKAKKIIISFYDYPNVEFVEFPTQSLNTNNLSIGGKKTIKKDLQKIRNLNLVKLYRNNSWVVDYFDFILTQKGKSYLLKEGSKSYYVVSNLREFNEVSGIRLNEGKTKATVDFKVKRNNVTPFGEFREYYEDETLEYQVKMELYDDGWRIINNKVKNYKKSDFKCFDEQYLSNLSKIADEITMESSISPCLIKDIYEKYGAVFVVLDYTRMEGSDPNGVPNYVNKNPKLRTFRVTNESLFFHPNYHYMGENDKKKKIKLSEIISLKKDLIDCMMWNVKVNDGIIQEISPVYFP